MAGMIQALTLQTELEQDEGRRGSSVSRKDHGVKS